MKKLKYSEKYKYIILLVLLCFLFLMFRNNGWDRTEITLGQAYKMAYEEVYKDNSTIMLDYITSVDIGEDTHDNEGHSGRRKHWNIDFAVPNTNSHYIVEIRNGEITNQQKVVGLKKEKHELIGKDDMAYDSSDIIHSSIERFNIMPGRVWAIGYHFTLNKEDGHAYQTLVCYDSDMNFCNIKMDIKTGEIISVKSKIRIGGGIVDENGNVFADTKYQISRLINGTEENEIVAAGYKYVNEIEYLPLILVITDSAVKEYVVVEDIYDLVCFGDYIYYINTGGIGRINLDTGEEEVVYVGGIVSWGTGGNNLVVADKNNIVLVNEQGSMVCYDNRESGGDVVKILDISDRGEIFCSNGKGIYKVSDRGVTEVVSHENENIKDMECYGDDVYIITEHNILIFDTTKNKMIMNIENKYEADVFLANYEGKQYMKSSTNEMIIYVGKEENEQVIQEIPDCGEVTDICYLSLDRKIYSYFSKFEWQDMP